MQLKTEPVHVIEAVTHPDPYAFYARLVAECPLYYDELLKAWVAASAEAVSAVMSHPNCYVRPLSEPVPYALIGSAAGLIFQHLARMNDGEKHAQLKPAVTGAAALMVTTRLSTMSQQWAADLAQKKPHPTLPLQGEGKGGVMDFAFELPLYVMAEQIGIPADLMTQTVQWMRQFADCLNPLSSLQKMEAGKFAADNLMGLLQRLVGQSRRSPLLTHLVEKVGNEAAAANAIGLMFQAYEATAGLIGNSLIALAAYPHLYQQITHDPSLLTPFIAEVIRYDPSVQNTRRFLHEDAIIAGQSMQAGDAILVILAAANHDPVLNPDPHEFQLFRENRRYFTFGMRSHACPGELLALVIARAGVEQWLHRIPPITRVEYHPYINLRLPIFS